MIATPTSDRISVTTNPTFWEVFVASLIILIRRWQFIPLHAIFPLAGLFLLLTPFITGDHLGVIQIMMALLAFSFTPLITAYAIWIRRRRNKLAKGPFTYSFDLEGMHTSGESFSQTIRWSGILRVRCSKRFLFIFTSPSMAHCIPVREISDTLFLDNLRNLAKGRTDFKSCFEAKSDASI